MASKKRQQTINKRNRERAVEEKRTLKRQRKQEKREAARSGEAAEIDAIDPGDEQPDAPSPDGSSPVEKNYADEGGEH